MEVSIVQMQRWEEQLLSCAIAPASESLNVSSAPGTYYQYRSDSRLRGEPRQLLRRKLLTRSVYILSQARERGRSIRLDCPTGKERFYRASCRPSLVPISSDQQTLTTHLEICNQLSQFRFRHCLLQTIRHQ